MNNQDILSDLGHLALASRLKRLADSLLADASKIQSASGEPLQPGQFPLIAALDRYGPMTVNDAAAVLGVSQPAVTRAVSEAVKIGIVTSNPSENDKRFRELALTELGQNSVARLKRSVWLRVDAAARGLTHDLPDGFLASITEIERRLAERSMVERVRANTLSVVPFSDDLAGHFHDINVEWIEAMFTIEPHDREVLSDPRTHIIDNGGQIYFVQKGDGEILGTCALAAAEGGFIELTKMAVLKSARGQGAGEFLLRFVLERIRGLGQLDRLFLASNKKNVAAIGLYQKLGFVHDPDIMRRFGSLYERCDVAMSHSGHIPS
ncbi:MAG: helix-turn-helix domain-containing GNAT family N-acetyltransferase [Pseudomonadota bacterium]